MKLWLLMISPQVRLRMNLFVYLELKYDSDINYDSFSQNYKCYPQ